MGKTREKIEAGSGGSYQISNFIQSGGAGGDIFWIGDMGAINGHGEALSRGKYGFLTTGDGEKGEADFRRDLDKGGRRERTEGSGDTYCKDVHRQETGEGGLVGGPLAHI